jgi:hypothetical protein
VTYSLDQHLLVSAFRLCVCLVLLAVIFVPLEHLFALHPEKIFRKGSPPMSPITFSAASFPAS